MGEIISCGRKDVAKYFFSKFHSLTRVYYDGKLLVKENVLLRPSISPLQVKGQWEGYTHQASLIYWNEKSKPAALMTGLQELLKDAPGLCLSISLLPVNGLLVRMLGHLAEQLSDLFKKAAAFIQQQQLLVAAKWHRQKKPHMQAEPAVLILTVTSISF